MIKDANDKEVFRIKMRGRSFSLDPLKKERAASHFCKQYRDLGQDARPFSSCYSAEYAKRGAGLRLASLRV